MADVGSGANAGREDRVRGVLRRRACEDEGGEDLRGFRGEPVSFPGGSEQAVADEVGGRDGSSWVVM